MPDKLTADDIQISASPEKTQKDLLDPVTTATIGAAAWFTLKAVLQGVIGYIAVKLFEPIWNWWNSKERDEPSTKLSDKESQSKS